MIETDAAPAQHSFAHRSGELYTAWYGFPFLVNVGLGWMGMIWRSRRGNALLG